MTAAVSSNTELLSPLPVNSGSSTTFFLRGARFAGAFFFAAFFFGLGFSSVTPSPKSSSVKSSGAAVFLVAFFFAFFFVAVFFLVADALVVLRRAFGFSSALELLVGIGNPDFQIRMLCAGKMAKMREERPTRE